MPPTHLTSVDLPAPLSPTRAVTSPAYTVKSTSRRTCTAPKLLLMPCSSNSGVVMDSSGIGGRCPGTRGRGRRDTERSANPGRRALGGVRTGTQVVLGHVPVGDDVLDVVLVDRHRRLQDRLDVLTAGRVLQRLGGGRVLPLGQ